jgi:hypothetical protein
MKKLLLFSLTILLLVACLKDNKTSWETEILTPIVKSNLTISDILNSDDVLENPDSSLKLIYSTKLYSLTADSLVVFPDTVFEFGASLESLELPNDTITYSLTLGEIARAQGGLIRFLILNSHGDSVPIPALSGLSSGNIEIALGSLFESIELDSGTAKVIISNELPMDIENVDFMVSNSLPHGGDSILRDVFPSIPVNEVRSKEIPINGKTIYANLIAKIVELSTPGSIGNRVLIDTNDALVAQIIIKDLKPLKATAIWPEQNVINQTKLVVFAPESSYLFKDVLLRDGDITFEIFSNLQDSVYIKYTVPNLIHPITGMPFIIDTVVPPPANEGEVSKINVSYPLHDYYFLLNGYGIEDYYTPNIDYDGSGNPTDGEDALNSYVTILEARIQYSGQLKEIALDDSVYVNASIKNLVTEFARGHMGNTIKNIGPDSVYLTLFNKVKSGKIDLEEVFFEIEANNGIGATVLTTFNTLLSENAEGNIVTLAMNENTMNINKANDSGTLSNHVVSKKTFNTTNSNISEFISNLPNKIFFDIKAEINGVDNPSTLVNSIIGNPPNFLYYESGMNVNLNMEIPLSFIADSLLLVDTVDFSFNSQGRGDIISSDFTLVVENGFPFDAVTTLYFMDANDNLIDSLFKDQTIIRADVDASGRVSSTNQSEIKFSINPERMELIKTAEKIITKAGFHTFDAADPSKKHYKIYSYYDFKIKLVGDFNYMLPN